MPRKKAPADNRPLCDWQPIATAPRDGRVIILHDEDVGAFPMAWNASAENGLFPGCIGFWEALDGSFTWSEHDGAGPSQWAPLEPAAHPTTPEQSEKVA